MNTNYVEWIINVKWITNYISDHIIILIIVIWFDNYLQRFYFQASLRSAMF